MGNDYDASLPGPSIDYFHAAPSPPGFQLYAVACNKNELWHTQKTMLFDLLPGIKTLEAKSFNPLEQQV